MIHHLSISAQNPEHVASVLAELIGGEVFPFPPADGAFVAVCDDEYATLVEVYPAGTVMIPGQDDQPTEFIKDEVSSHSPTHVALSVSLDKDAINAIAKREGWRAVTCDRGGLFKVVEFWIENRQLFELLTPDMARDYLSAMTTQNWKRFID